MNLVLVQLVDIFICLSDIEFGSQTSYDSLFFFCFFFSSGFLVNFLGDFDGQPGIPSVIANGPHLCITSNFSKFGLHFVKLDYDTTVSLRILKITGSMCNPTDDLPWPIFLFKYRFVTFPFLIERI